VRRYYRVREFARLAGVTVKALQHYDRLGLLRPARTAAGHRLYGERDRDRLDQILALKFLGIPLKRIRAVLAGDVVPLSEALRVQREALTLQRDQLTRAIATIERAQSAIGCRRGPNAQFLRQLTDIVMPKEPEGMRKYFTDEAWERWGSHYDDWPPPSWRELYEDVLASLDEDPCGERAESLLVRMVALWHRDTGGDRQVQWQIHEGVMKAWRDRDHWPEPMRQRFEELRMGEIGRFLGRVSQMVALKRGADYVKNLQVGLWTAA
jgi:DNA-binding transcriptional MerR regulator